MSFADALQTRNTQAVLLEGARLSMIKAALPDVQTSSVEAIQAQPPEALLLLLLGDVELFRELDLDIVAELALVSIVVSPLAEVLEFVNEATDGFSGTTGCHALLPDRRRPDLSIT